MKFTFTLFVFIHIFFSVSAQSVLKDGDVYKFSIADAGIYKLDYNFLKNELKIANLDQIDPRNIKIYGNGGGMLPEANNIQRPADLIENSIVIAGEDDGKFDAGDFILLYSVGADKWQFNVDKKTFDKPKNIYDSKTFYFLKITDNKGLRLATQTNPITADYKTSTYDYRERYEVDQTNVLASNSCMCTQGAGKIWLGDVFTANLTQQNYAKQFDFSNIITTEPVKVFVRMAAESANYSAFNVDFAGKSTAQTLQASTPNGLEESNADISTIDVSYLPTGNNFEPKVIFSPNSAATAWLDFLQITVRKTLTYNNVPLSFRDLKSLDYNSTAYQIGNVNASVDVWDISTPTNPVGQKYTPAGANISFSAANKKQLKEFIVFDRTTITNKPAAVGKISNQNIHGIGDIDLLIVYPKDFAMAAKKLADYRRTHSNYAVEAVEIGQVYNEFSSGGQDPAAIRDLARLLHQRSARFKYLLLMGDGSFDYKRIYALGNQQPSDFIPPYETDESFDPINAYPSDDFYGLLSDDEGVNLNGSLDIGVGRITCKTEDEAMGVVNKIIHYENSLGDWRNKSVFVADNGDNNTHLNDADFIADGVFKQYQNLNIDKLYIDAFPQVVSSGGTRVPAINSAIYQDQYNGMLTMTYLGHGGPSGLAQERILQTQDLATWTNFDKLPLIITATCSFSGYDNPKVVSAGETALLNPNGGAVALFSTVRAVYANTNAQLTQAVFDNIFVKKNAQAQTLGDIIVAAKNSSNTGVNGQKFTLLGDPSMRLAMPHYQINTNTINNKSADNFSDTIKALQTVTITGDIRDENNQILNNFNGTIFPTIYDKPVTARTLGQDVGATDHSIARDFTIQRSVLFKGKATVKSGKWSFNFVIPKDIDYRFGVGKISYYATDSITDASGNYEKMVIGGSSTLTSAATPPSLQLYMNDETFISGGTTNPSPKLIVNLSDNFGINVTGTSIGHDLTAQLDSTKDVYVLNNFYEALKDNSKQGVVKFPLSNLNIGAHKIKVRAWNLADLSSEATIDFIVSADANGSIKRVYNYPNPFSKTTTFVFEHSLASQNAKIVIGIYALNGILIKNISKDITTTDSGVNYVDWDDTADSVELERGFYIYRITFTGVDLQGKILTVQSPAGKFVKINE